MKKILLAALACALLASCGNFHGKQPIDDEYYKNTQSVAWPDENTTVATRTTSVPAKGSSVRPYEATVEIEKPKVAVPDAIESKFECKRNSSGDFTCSYGLDQCGEHCKADGSNCKYGNCLQSDCDNVLGQKWELVKEGNYSHYYVCKHPSYPIYCKKYGNGNSSYKCFNSGYECGSECNANGTLCKSGHNNCWDEYR